MTKPKEVPDFLEMFPKVFVKEVPEKLPPVHKILQDKSHRPDEAFKDTHLQSATSFDAQIQRMDQ